MYQSQGKLDEYEKLKPTLTENQIHLLNAFYRLSQERQMRENIPSSIRDKEIHYYQSIHGSCFYAPDIFVHAMRSIDSQYIQNTCDEIRRKTKKG